jgi:predicted negative regulator of RcsB-dependent stress response
MTGQKTRDQSLKRPDSFQDQVLTAINFVTTNKQRVLMMMAPLLIVASGVYATYLWTQKKAENRRAELAKILTQHSDEESSVAKKREEIQKQIEPLRNTKTDKDGKKTPTSPENLATITKLEKQIADLKPDHTKSLVEFKRFYDANSDTVEGWMAGLKWASNQLQESQSGDARKVVEQVAKASAANKFYQMNSRFILIGLMEDAGEFDGALKECEILIKIASDDAMPSVLLTKARIQFFKKSFDDAKTSLKEILDKHSSSPEATKARGLMAIMGAA